jgi:hypothetical protein
MQLGEEKVGRGGYMDDDWDAKGVGPGFDRVCINLQHAVALIPAALKARYFCAQIKEVFGDREFNDVVL